MLKLFTKTYKPIVLLVDDNIYIRKLLAKILEANYKVYTAMDGLEALALLHHTLKPDLIITDIAMPRMNGYEFIKALKAHGLYRLIPICILSDIHPNTLEAELQDMQVEEIFTKPFDPDLLMKKLEKVLSKAQEPYRV